MPQRNAWIAVPTMTLAGCVAGLIGLGWFFLTRPSGQIVDQLALLGASEFLDHPSGRVRSALYEWVTAAALPVRDLVGVWFIVVVMLLVLAIAALRRRWGHALAAAVLYGGANLTTQGIKLLWRQPEHDLYQTYGNSWPSGHTTLVAAAVFALLLVAPGRWRWAVALLGSIVMTLVAWGTVLSAWHRPSDTVGAFLVAAIWYVLVEIVRRSLAHVPLSAGIRSPGAIRVLDVLSGICAALGVGILAATLLTLPDGPVADMEVAIQRLAFVGAFFGIAAVALGTNRVLLAAGPHED